MAKPKIGIVPRTRFVEEVNFAFDNTHNNIRMSIQENGGTPRILLSQQNFGDYDPRHNQPIPPLTDDEKKKIEIEIRSCDGICLTDITPVGEYEEFIVDCCKKYHVPIMGINGFSLQSKDFSTNEVAPVDSKIKGFIQKSSKRATAREAVLTETNPEYSKRDVPRIAIISKQLYLDEETVFNRVADGVRYAVVKSGAIARGIIPQTSKRIFNKSDEHDETILTEEEKRQIESELADCEAIVLPGGLASNAYEEYVIKYAYENNIPLMGICAGMNNLVRALGGTTIRRQDLAKRHNDPQKQHAHGLKVVKPDSKFSSIVKKAELQVNSIHSYFIDKVPYVLEVVALDDEGNIEVVEAKDRKFFIGTKYHPELLVDCDIEQQKLFSELSSVAYQQLLHKKRNLANQLGEQRTT